MQTSGSSQNANGSYAQMTMLANTAIAVEHRHRRSPDVDAPAILVHEDAARLLT